VKVPVNQSISQSSVGCMSIEKLAHPWQGCLPKCARKVAVVHPDEALKMLGRY